MFFLQYGPWSDCTVADSVSAFVCAVLSGFKLVQISHLCSSLKSSASRWISQRCLELVRHRPIVQIPAHLYGTHL